MTRNEKKIAKARDLVCEVLGDICTSQDVSLCVAEGILQAAKASLLLALDFNIDDGERRKR